jgi:microcystin-dependent protein
MVKRLFTGIAIILAVTTAALAQAVVPVGSIVAFAGAAAPRGWLMCDGNAIPTGAQYDLLRKLMGNTTPDLRGYFLRGIDPTGQVDPDSKPPNVRAMFSEQKDAVGPHTHTYTRHLTSGPGKSGSDAPEVGTMREVTRQADLRQEQQRLAQKTRQSIL